MILYVYWQSILFYCFEIEPFQIMVSLFQRAPQHGESGGGKEEGIRRLIEIHQ